VRYKRFTAPSALHPVSTGKNLGNKYWLVSMILSLDGLMYGLCALMCGGVAALDGTRNLDIWNEKRNTVAHDGYVK